MKSVCVSAHGGANGGAGGGGAGSGDTGSSAGAADVGAAPQAGGIPEATSQMVTVARMRYQRHLGRREVVALGRCACAGARRSIRVRQQQARLLNHLGWFRMSRTTCWPVAASVSTFRCRASSRRLTRTGPSPRALRRRSSRSRSPCPCQRSFATSWCLRGDFAISQKDFSRNSEIANVPWAAPVRRKNKANAALLALCERKSVAAVHAQL